MYSANDYWHLSSLLLQQQLTTSVVTRPCSQAISYTPDNKWKTKSCEAQMTTDTVITPAKATVTYPCCCYSTTLTNHQLHTRQQMKDQIMWSISEYWHYCHSRYYKHWHILICNCSLGSINQCSPQQLSHLWNVCTSSKYPVNFECPPDSPTTTCAPTQQTCHEFGDKLLHTFLIQHLTTDQ